MFWCSNIAYHVIYVQYNKNTKSLRELLLEAFLLFGHFRQGESNIFLGNFGVLLLFVDIRQGDCILSETASLKSVFYVKNGCFELKLGKGRRPPPGEKERGFLPENPGLTTGIAPAPILCGKTVYP